MNAATDVLPRAIALLQKGQSLDAAMAQQVMDAVLDDECADDVVYAWLTAQHKKGETEHELLGYARSLRAHSVRVPIDGAAVVDTCGTGGGRKTFNISTAAAIVAASLGVRIAKHGNRAVTSTSGSTDVLEALGVRIQLTPSQTAACLERCGVCFLYAPTYHPAIMRVAHVRKRIRTRTVFNVLGPLVGPAHARRQVIGVSDDRLLEPIAKVLRALGSERALVVRGADGMDELSVFAPTFAVELHDGHIMRDLLSFRSAHYGDYSNIAGGDAAHNATLIRTVFAEPKANITASKAIALNVAAVLYVSGYGLDWRKLIEMASTAIEDGRAFAKLEQLIHVTKELADVS
ncbi:MAG: anthranilate phosphoribosyltransferase [Paenibacillaceae bacterium]|nr:anthranilate phosphoribosyltransferase [Paenibacillaceae bacterium]